MKIDSNNFLNKDKVQNQATKPNNLAKKALENNQILNDRSFVNNGYSSLEHKELNNAIGILQLANTSIEKILNNSNINLDEAKEILSQANFFGAKIFANNVILKDSYGGLLFDANRILTIIPSDNRDIYSFKKALKLEQNLIKNSLDSIQNKIQIQNEPYLDMNSYLTSNANLFSKAHNTEGLALRLDSLLA
ncbi:MAG: hypothetical protein K2P17_02720 [Helicobacteraceae bacterium]|nr:hypothetical protein [Helicobacteraceae bacterium]